MTTQTLTRPRRARRPRTDMATAVLLLLAAGCGTTRMTDTQRTATEQLLISNAVDQAVSHLDLRGLSGKPVYLDPQYLDGAVDRGYLVSTLRQHLLACGCLLQEDRKEATYVVEARSGGIGTDRHSVLVGIPQTTVPAIIPGQPTSIPEIPFAKTTDQKGLAKVAVFAYNRKTGQPVFQSGVVQALSSAKDVWVLGAGPFQNGTIRDEVTFAGGSLPGLGGHGAGQPVPTTLAVTKAATWPEKPAPSEALAATPPPVSGKAPGPRVRLIGPAPERKEDGPRAARAEGAKAPANDGGKEETQPVSVLVSGLFSPRRVP